MHFPCLIVDREIKISCKKVENALFGESVEFLKELFGQMNYKDSSLKPKMEWKISAENVPERKFTAQIPLPQVLLGDNIAKAYFTERYLYKEPKK